MSLPTVLMTVLSLAALAAEDPQPKPKVRPRPKAAGRPADYGGIVTAAAPPSGYTVRSAELKNGGKVLGHSVVVEKPGSASKAIVMVEARDIVSRGEKVAALKGFVNGTAQGLVKAGARLVEQKVPDIEKADLDKPVVVFLVFANPKPGGENLRVELLTFFEKKRAYNLTIVGDNKADFDALNVWAKTVKAAP